MSETSLFKLYSKLPIWLQNAACTLAGISMRRNRYNRKFFEVLDFLGKSEYWSLGDLQAYQDEELKKLIKHAYDTVPYYHELFDDLKLKPTDFKAVGDLPKLPILEKKTVRERFNDMQSKGWPRKRMVYGHTGGTTGTALKLMADIDTQPWQWAVWWRHRHRFGLDIKDSFIVFAGRSVVPLDNMEPPFWRRNWPMHQTYVSIHHMTKNNMPVLVNYLQKRQVKYYSGYPSALYLLATYLLDNNISLRYPPQIVVTGAETVLPHQRRTIEKAFGAVLADQYGASEQCGNISECEKHLYHVDMEFGVIEFLPLEGVTSNVRRIICTGFHNPVMPLIRYNIGDIATLKEGSCNCGRKSPVVEKIDGRIESYIITPDGRQLGRLDFLFKESHQAKEAQLVQDTLEHITVNIVRGNQYSAADEQSLMKELKLYLGEQLKIDLAYVDEIAKEPNGKFRQIISHVFYDRYRDIELNSQSGTRL